MHDLVIRGGRVVTDSGVIESGIAIDGELISEVGPDPGPGRREMDASGLHVFPGLVDLHVHFNEPGRTEWEGAATGSRAFAAGGGTLFGDMPLNSTPCTTTCAAFDLKSAALHARSITDFALWGGMVPGNRGELAEMAAKGALGFKAFLCDSGLPEFPRADDLTLYHGLQEAASCGLPVAVHAESEEITRGLVSRMMQAGRHDIRSFLESRPVIAEVEAIARAALLAREAGAKLHIVHISSGSGVAEALEQRARGTDLSIETCPHYLFFTEDDLLRIGAIAKCAPPLRSAEERELLWTRTLDGAVEIIGSDHSPCPPEMKNRENFFEIWGGIAGIQSTLAVMIEEGHHLRGLSLASIARKLATRPAERFGMLRKGRIDKGFHADLALVDVGAEATVLAESLEQRHPLSPYAGIHLRGKVKQTIRRGEQIWGDGASNKTRGTLVRPWKW